MHPEPIVYALFGLVIGSFLNVCIYRMPLGKSVVSPRSACPNCGTPIRALDNIPVLSYLILLGRCRTCKAAISIQYPIVELMTGAAFFGCAMKWNFAAPTFVNTLLLSITIVLVFTDLHHRILPNVLTLPGIVAGILLSPFQSRSFYSFDWISSKVASLIWPGNPQSLLPWTGSIVGAIIGGGILLVVGFLYEKLRKKQGLGMGDVKMLAMVGAFLGYPLAIVTLMAGSIFGTLLGISLILAGRGSLQTKLAFGVFLGIGTVLSVFYGLPFLFWYLRIPH
jgi:leader peptidase (prepilin peptidase) / N-methyltransferase